MTQEPGDEGRPVTIYLLRDPFTSEARYIGATVRPLRVRLQVHLQRARARKTPVQRWLVALIHAGKRPAAECIETAGRDWQERERFWIAHYRAGGAPLTNVQAGGRGFDSETAKAMWTPERRDEQGQKTAEMNRGRAGEKWTDERKEQQSASQSRRWQNEDERAAARTRMTAVAADPQYRAKQSKSVAASWSEERRRAQTEIARRVNQLRWGKKSE